jgi:hypothetical protein
MERLLYGILISERGGGGLDDLPVLLAPAATDAYRAYHLATARQRQTAGEDHYSAVVGRLDTVEFLTRLREIRQLLRGDIKRPRRESFVDRDVDAAKPCLLHARESEQIAARIHYRDVGRRTYFVRLGDTRLYHALRVVE